LKTFENPRSISEFIDELVFRFLGGEASENIKNKIFQALLGDLNEDHWSEEINNLINSTSSAEQSYSNIDWRLGNAFEIMGQTGEFHLF
jgi:hypothetical protein